MKKNSRMYFSNIVVLLLLPYLITILINGYDMAVLNQKADSETVLPVILALQISSDYEPETIKAQAVIARSNLYRKIGEKESINRNGDQNKKERDARSEKFFETCRELRDELPSCWSVWEKVDKVYEEAVEDTSGQVLTYNGELKLVPYHQISAGQTRDGETAFHNEEYAYLKAVDSNSDKTAPGYLNSTYIAKQQLPVELRIVEREDSGYVVSLMADENIVEAESFVTGMGIASSDFSMQKTGEQVRFLSKGKGHGLGFSQYGGNKVAKLCGSPKKAANWFMGEVLRLTKDKALDVEKVSFTPEHLADLIQMVEKKEVSAQNAKKVFEKVFEEDIDPVSYIEEHGLKIVEDTGLLKDTLQKILDENPGPLEELLGGKEKVFGFFVGKMMRELKGKASPDAVREALVKEVEKRKNQ